MTTKAKRAAPRRAPKRVDWHALAIERARQNQELRAALASVRSLLSQHYTGVESVIDELPVEAREGHIGVAHRVAGDALRTPQT